jgi:hypothetical protein
VSDIVPGQSFLARDLIRGGEPVRVVERSATRQMKVWDRIGARIVPLAGGYQMSGGVLVYDLELSEKLIADLARLEVHFERMKQSLAEEAGAKPDGARIADFIQSRSSLEAAAPVFTRVWLTDALGHVLNPRLPSLVNVEGDPIVYCTQTFPLAAGASVGDVCAALAAADDLSQAGETFFNWVGPIDAPASPPPRSGITREVVLSDGRRVLGTIEVTDAAVVVETNSRQRAERVKARLTGILGAQVGAPTLTAETVEEALARREAPPARDAPPPQPLLPPDEERRIVHCHLDDHFRRTLDKELPMLDGMTPRQAVGTAAGRAKVVTWLKYLENQSQKRPDPGDAIATYDLAWLWTELGIAELRS